MTPAPAQRANRATAGVIICQSWDAEPYYRRAAKRLGWQQVPQQKDPRQPFHIRFNVSDLEGAGTDVKPNQIYNHFPCNRELTTKAGLCKNLWFNCFAEQEHRTSLVFPRCYDLSDGRQVEQFVADFNQTAILSTIKVMADHFLKTGTYLEDLLTEYQKMDLFENPRNAFKQKFVQKCHAIDSDRVQGRGGGCLPGSDEVRTAYQYAKQLLNALQCQDPARNPRAKRRRGECSRAALTDEQIAWLVQC